MQHPDPRRLALLRRPTMKHVIIGGLVAAMTLGGAFSAGAASRTVQTSAIVEMEFWVSLDNRAAFVTTRQEGEEWTTHDFRVELDEYPGLPTLLVSEPVNVSIPVTVQVDVDEPFPEPRPAAEPHLPPGEAPSGRGRCCTVRGMWDEPAKQRAVASEMRRVITYARANLGLTHQGPITINIAHTVGGLNVRYREAFGEPLETLPSECSFQRGEHIFIGPACRTDTSAIAREWFLRAVQTHYASARWAGVATFEYYWNLYARGAAPNLRDDRYRSAIFHQPPSSFREGRAHEDLMTAAALFAIETYGTIDDWLTFYDDLMDGAELHSAFEAAFGVSLLRFYVDFEDWAERQRTILLSVAYASCQEAARYVRPRAADEGGGFADFHVPLEWDHDGDGYVCEQYAAFDQDDLSCLVVGAVSPADVGR